MKNAIVLTGSIASGKSTVCNLLKLYGFPIIDADSISHQILDEQSRNIAEIFGREYIIDKKVDRKKLGALIFNNTAKKQKLESLLHPLIKQKILQQSAKLDIKNVPYIIDIPLFFETKNYDIQKVALVYAPKEMILERLIKRENMSEQEAINRLSLQIDIEEKKKLASFIIDNSQNLRHLQKEVDSFIQRIYNKTITLL